MELIIFLLSCSISLIFMSGFQTAFAASTVRRDTPSGIPTVNALYSTTELPTTGTTTARPDLTTAAPVPPTESQVYLTPAPTTPVPIPTSCPEPQVLQMCGSSCAPTCTQPTPPDDCEESCTPGCFCSGGMIAYNGICIVAEQCPGIGYRRCPDSGNIAITCWDTCSREACASYPGAECRPDICDNCRPVFYSDGERVNCNALAEAARQCDAGEFYRDYGLPCESDCEGNLPDNCFDIPLGCICMPGFVRQDGVCIHPAECPVTATENYNEEDDGGSDSDSDSESVPCPSRMEWKDCGSSCTPTCTDPRPASCVGVGLECISGCFCQQGYVKHEGGCIHLDECPAINPIPSATIAMAPCESPLIWNDCGRACEPSCSDPIPECALDCVPGCYCPDGLLLMDDSCISPFYCPMPPTPPTQPIATEPPKDPDQPLPPVPTLPLPLSPFTQRVPPAPPTKPVTTVPRKVPETTATEDYVYFYGFEP